MLFSPLLPLSSLPHSIPTLSLIFLSWNHTQCSHQAALYSTHSPVTIQVVCFFDFKLHSWHEIHQGEGVQKLYVCRVVLSLRLFPILWNSSLLLYCCCYFCCIYVSFYNYYHYWNLKEGEIKRRLLKKRDRDFWLSEGWKDSSWVTPYSPAPHITHLSGTLHGAKALRVTQGIHKLVL